MQHLLTCLQEGSDEFSFLVNSEEECTGLLIVPSRTKECTRQFSKVGQMDSAYRTNRYEMPLLHVVGMTNTNTSFTIALCFLRSESQANYRWALSELRTKLGNEYVSGVVVTDRELALMNAVAISFPRSKHLMCS
ncbi:hypothetical protein PybrP1_002537 [[Pythium] brassicae (nom. inval.)]|nr:hypothetical protein PybrP1_002537 [[Pythium] brassicae (nom. inval.)]